MATTETESGQDTISSKIAPWASGEHLRHVETEVIIPKILREKAKAKCDDLVQAFTQCAKGRTVSILWTCRKENQAMKDCLTGHYQDKELFEECRQEYLKKREEYQKNFAQSGKSAGLMKKESTI